MFGFAYCYSKIGKHLREHPQDAVYKQDLFALYSRQNIARDILAYLENIEAISDMGKRVYVTRYGKHYLSQTENYRVTRKNETGNIMLRSYSSFVAMVDSNWKLIAVSKHWNYSQTTKCHVRHFSGMNTKTIKQGIKDGTIRFIPHQDLNFND